MNPEFKQQIYYMVVIFSLVFALVLTKAAYPDNVPTCDKVLELCDKSNTECQELARSQRDLIAAQDNLIVKVTKQRNEALDMVKPDSTSFPWYVGIVLGVAGGVILTRGLR
jgi:hypothetical protein